MHALHLKVTRPDLSRWSPLAAWVEIHRPLPISSTTRLKKADQTINQHCLNLSINGLVVEYHNLHLCKLQV